MCSLENACRTSTTSRLVLVCAVILIAASGLLCISRIHTSRPAMEENRAFSGKVRALSGIPEDHEVEFVAVNSVKGFPHKSRRLPGDLVPGSYHLKIHVNLKALTFGGSVVIRILCRRATSRIILHSRNIDLMGVLVRPAEASPHTDGMAVRRVLAFDKFQQVCIELDDPLIEGKHYAVQLNFKAKISDSLEGLYKSVYYNSSKHARVVAVTHFEPAHARQAFPCFDEPSLKATFTVIIIHEPAYYAVSNMPRARELERYDGLVEDHFAPSVKMSTYLVAFAVIDFDHKETISKSGVKVRVHVPPGTLLHVDHALHTASKMLTFYEQLFDEPYELPKLDLLGVPDFLNGAMENWGLVIFRLQCLVYDQRYTPTGIKQKQAHIVAHELAHQWFGNLVTMEWWSDIWLNEGFAKFLQYLAVDHVEKDWHVTSYMIAETWMNALKADSAWSAHAVVKDSTPEENDSIFDAISYLKGASLLRMIHRFLGTSTFFKGLKEYIRDHKFANTSTRALWAALAKADGRPDFKTEMDPWVTQKSFPIVNVHSHGRIFKVSQESFLRHIKRPKKGGCEARDVWSIPISYTTESSPKEIRWSWLPADHVKHDLKVSTRGWVKVNINATGYFVVNYDEANWRKLIDQLISNHKVFAPPDRASLIHDAFTLSCEGLLDPRIALNLSTYLTKETHDVPWAVMWGTAKCLVDSHADKSTKSLYKKFLWRLQDHLVELVGLEDKGGSDVETLFQYNTLSEAVRYGQRPDVKAKFQDYFQEMKSSASERIAGMSADFRSLAFLYGANKSSDEDWRFVWSVYQNSTFDSDRALLMGALTAFKTDKIIKRNLRYSLDASKVRPQDTLFWLEKVNKGTGRKDARWTFIRRNWAALRRSYSGNFKLGNLISAVTSGFRTKHQLHQVQRFFNHFVTSRDIDADVQKSILAKIRGNMAEKPRLHQARSADITRWLQDFMRRKKEEESKGKGRN